MPSTIIVNNFTHPIIEADNRDPDVSWQHHLDRGSLGGDDLAYPFGTTVQAPAAGRFTYIQGNGSGGNLGQIHMADGRMIELMHLSARIAAEGSMVVIGQDVARSGASGFGDPNHYAPHLHVHLILVGGARVNLFHYFTSVTPATAAPAAVGKPITLPITLNRTRKKPTMLGFAMTNHGVMQWAVGVEKGVWLPVETQDDANAIAAIIGSFTVISVAAWNATKAAYLGTPTA
jgi:murein DD-endopeptidase MepM/ murein hydrolase activator NlpD